MNEYITRLYRAVVADAGREGITRREATEQVVAQARPLVDSGALVLDADDLIRQMVKRADESDGNRADHILADLANGADDLSLEVEPLLDYVVTLGRGQRKAWRFVGRNDLIEMNEVRFGNVRAAQTAYFKGFKPQYDAWLPILLKHATIGAAVAAGDLPNADADLFASA
ncbi:hypothetical protein [Nocardioides montaniterrae]